MRYSAQLDFASSFLKESASLSCSETRSGTLAESGGFKAGTARRSRSPPGACGSARSPGPSEQRQRGEGWRRGKQRALARQLLARLLPEAPNRAAKASRREAAWRDHTAKPSSGGELGDFTASRRFLALIFGTTKFTPVEAESSTATPP